MSKVLPRLPRRSLRSISTLRRGVRFVHDAAPRLLVASMVLQVVAGVATVLAVIVGGRLAERLVRVPDEGTDGLAPQLIAFLVFTFVALGAALIKREYQKLLAEKAAQHATDIVLDASVHAELASYESPEFHDLMVRALQSAGTRPFQLTAALLGLVSAATTIIGLGVALIALSPVLLVVVALGAVPLWLTARSATRLSYNYNVAQTERVRRHGYLLSALASRVNAAEIRVFGIGDELRSRAHRLHGKRIDDLVRVVRIRAILGVVGAFVSVAVTGVVLFVLAERFDSGKLALEDATVAAAALLVLSQRLQAVSSSAASVLECALFLGDIDRFAPMATGDTERRVPAIQTLALDRASFQYPAGDSPAVREIDLDLQRGELVALVGENGSGKTTVAKLLALLYSPTQGDVRINGQVHDPADSASYRRRIAVVHQDYLQLLLSAADNIGLGDIDALGDRTRVLQAARFAQIDEAVEAMPDGFDTMLGTEFSGGQELSGGQWQRMAIARAWFRDADVVILDEPTSALDPTAEVDLIDRVQALAADKIIVLISHRFGTVARADRIVVMNEGHVVESGPHDVLMAQRGVYASLYSVQASSFERP